jgi:DNA mismatch endonuclease (patch repair protein)
MRAPTRECEYRRDGQLSEYVGGGKLMDRVSFEMRSKMMAGVRSKHTDIELLVRREAHRLGYRFRLHVGLPGKPDMVFPKLKVAMFVHGCFWHGHECRRGALPASNREFWRAKIQSNRERDRQMRAKLEQLGWTVEVIWGCEAKSAGSLTTVLEAALSR